MHTLTIQVFAAGQSEQGTNNVRTDLGGTGISGHPETISSAGYVDVEAAFYLPQVLIKLAAKIGQAVVIGGFQDDVLRYLYGVQFLKFRPLLVDGSKPTAKVDYMEYRSSHLAQLRYSPSVYKASTQGIRQSLGDNDVHELP